MQGHISTLISLEPIIDGDSRASSLSTSDKKYLFVLLLFRYFPVGYGTAERTCAVHEFQICNSGIGMNSTFCLLMFTLPKWHPSCVLGTTVSYSNNKKKENCGTIYIKRKKKDKNKTKEKRKKNISFGVALVSLVVTPALQAKRNGKLDAPFELIKYNDSTRKFEFDPSDGIAEVLSMFGDKPFKIVCIGGSYRYSLSRHSYFAESNCDEPLLKKTPINSRIRWIWF
jgi:hypothetical protein